MLSHTEMYGHFNPRKAKPLKSGDAKLKGLNLMRYGSQPPQGSLSSGKRIENFSKII